LTAAGLPESLAATGGDEWRLGTTMTTRLGGAVLLAVLTAALAGCGGDDDGGGSSASAARPCTGTIGVMAPVTGDAAMQGLEQVHFARLAVDRYNRGHGTRFKVAEGDTGLDPAQASTVAQQYLSDDAVVALVGPASSQQVEAIGPLLERAGMAAVSASATGGELTRDGRHPTFSRVVPPDTVQGSTDAAFIADRLKADRVMVVDDQTSYSTGLADTVERELERRGVEVRRESVSQKAADLSALASRVGTDTDVVFLPWLAANAQQFGRQLAEQGARTTIFGADGLFAPGVFDVEGSYVSSFAPDIRGIPGTQDVVRAFRARYGDFGTYGPPAYAAAVVVAGAMQRACGSGGGRPARDAVAREVRRTDLPTSILGRPLRFTPDGDLRDARFFIFRVEDGEFALVDP
jgi:branched-chain amino acid transport system substrate-binding protein